MMRGDLETSVLREVSRSFYLSLRFLPKPMRRPAGIAYLLARTSDTIADADGLSLAERKEYLIMFGGWVRGGRGRFSKDLTGKISNSGERILLERCDEVLAALESLPWGQIDLVREVLEIIIGGQRNDLEVFGAGDRDHVICLPDAGALDDYTFRVAGCVGAFWTKLGYETLGAKFSKHPEGELFDLGVMFGKGLQLVNILRDLAEDRKNGRCYLPVSDAGDEVGLMREFGIVRSQAVEKVEAGFAYAEKLSMKRLRVATALPAMIARETLELLDGVTFSRLQERIKVPRRRVYRMVAEAWLHC
jgi:farnesyl-diphosphate farnesyltransferase